MFYTKIKRISLSTQQRKVYMCKQFDNKENPRATNSYSKVSQQKQQKKWVKF